MIRCDGRQRSVESVARVDRALIPFACLGPPRIVETDIIVDNGETLLVKDHDGYYILFHHDGTRLQKVIQPSLPTRTALKKLIVAGLQDRGIAKTDVRFKEYYHHASQVLIFALRQCPADSRWARRAADVVHEQLDLLLRYR